MLLYVHRNHIRDVEPRTSVSSSTHLRSSVYFSCKALLKAECSYGIHKMPDSADIKRQRLAALSIFHTSKKRKRKQKKTKTGVCVWFLVRLFACFGCFGLVPPPSSHRNLSLHILDVYDKRLWTQKGFCCCFSCKNNKSPSK